MLFGAFFKWLRYALPVVKLQAQKINQGQGLVEYALILVLVAVAVIVVLSLLGPTIGNVFSNIVCGVLDAQNASCN
ncbi:MAG TPA: Flp family type IVb pilin [Phototrophicaceae bacterium]|jgi:pilus assembly protein Flp/PilA|nr:Flp family type IVb pilin [Phototrophicaceae bacterium]